MTHAWRNLVTGLMVVGVMQSLSSLPKAATAEPTELRIGVAETDITPPTGFPMAGYYHERLATGTADPLKAKAIVFHSAGERAALVTCDLIGISADLSAEVRRRAADQTGIPATHIVLAATHSHTAPDYTPDLVDYLGDESEQREQRYAARLIGGIVESIRVASAQAQPVQVLAGTARQEVPIAFNRRFVTRDGSVRTWMRLDDPNVVRAAGPIDPEVGVLLVRSAASDQPLGVLSNFALHLDTRGGTLWSADYPYHVELAVRQSLGAGVISLFGNGCCGDINHVDPQAAAVNKTDRIGQLLGETVTQGLSTVAAVAQPVLRVRTAQVQLPLQDITPEDVARARPLVADAKAGKEVEFFTLVTAYKTLVLDHLRHGPQHSAAGETISWGRSRIWAGIGSHLPADVQVIALGQDVAIVCLPGEVFVDLGLAIKRASPFRTTLVIELCNCVETIYIPPRVAYAVGSYEVTNSAVQPGTGELLAETAVRLLREAAAN